MKKRKMKSEKLKLFGARTLFRLLTFHFRFRCLKYKKIANLQRFASSYLW